MRQQLIPLPALVMAAILIAFSVALAPAASAGVGAPPAPSSTTATPSPADPTIDQVINTLSAESPSSAQLADIARAFEATGGQIVYSGLATSRGPDGQIEAISLGATDPNARYNPLTGQSEGTIAINDLLATAPPEFAAAVLAHEATHLLDLSTLGPAQLAGPSGCFGTELRAFDFGTTAWGEMRGNLPSTASLTSDQRTISALNDSELQMLDNLLAAQTPAAQNVAWVQVRDFMNANYAAECQGELLSTESSGPTPTPASVTPRPTATAGRGAATLTPTRTATPATPRRSAVTPTLAR